MGIISENNTSESHTTVCAGYSMYRPYTCSQQRLQLLHLVTLATGTSAACVSISSFSACQHPHRAKLLRSSPISSQVTYVAVTAGPMVGPTQAQVHMLYTGASYQKHTQSPDLSHQTQNHRPRITPCMHAHMHVCIQDTRQPYFTLSDAQTKDACDRSHMCAAAAVSS